VNAADLGSKLADDAMNCLFAAMSESLAGQEV
jgi:hypothetical protein